MHGSRHDEAFNSLWYNKEKDCLLVGYVDEFKMACKAGQMKCAWEDIAQHIEVDEVAPLDHRLGCKHVRFETTINGTKGKGMEYNMVDYTQNCVDTY